MQMDEQASAGVRLESVKCWRYVRETPSVSELGNQLSIGDQGERSHIDGTKVVFERSEQSIVEVRDSWVSTRSEMRMMGKWELAANV